MIITKTKKEIEVMRQGGKILAGILKKLCQAVEPGITTGQLEEMALTLIKAAGARPSFKGYKSMMETKAFPTALCTSINDEIVHAPALPSRKLKNGDIIGIDVGIEFPYAETRHGYYTDIAATVPVGKISREAAKLISVTRRSLDVAIEKVKPGNNLNDIGSAVQDFVEAQGFTVVRDLVGHGVGTAVHEDPQIPNYSISDGSLENHTLKPGMTLALEPMVNIGNYNIKGMPDGYTIATADGSLSAHFEHTIAVTKDGHMVLTAL